MRNIAEVTTAVANGDLSKKITVDVEGRDPRAEEHDQHDGRPAHAVRGGGDARRARGRHRGKLGGQADVPGVAGTWKDLTDNVNSMAGEPDRPGAQHRRVTTAVANGDCRKKITVDAKGEILELKDTINTMVDQLNVVRVGGDARRARGRHRGQARRAGRVPGVAGTWKDLTDNVNLMAVEPDRPGAQHRRVTTAVANGDLSKKITVECEGEILELKNTINTMVDQLSSFAAEVTRVAREVGTEGKLGGQAEVQGVAGRGRT